MKWILTVVLGLGVVGIGVCWYPQSSRVDAAELIVDPSQLSELGGVQWRRQASSAADVDSAVWRAYEVGSDREVGDYILNVRRSRNSLAARWQYRFTQRTNYEDEIPGSTIDADGGLALGADEFDVYCYDYNGAYRQNKSQCPVWVYWARYNQFRVTVSFNNKQLGLDDGDIRQTIQDLDRRIMDVLN